MTRYVNNTNGTLWEAWQAPVTMHVRTDPDAPMGFYVTVPKGDYLAYPVDLVPAKIHALPRDNFERNWKPVESAPADVQPRTEFFDARNGIMASRPAPPPQQVHIHLASGMEAESKSYGDLTVIHITAAKDGDGA